MLKVNVTTTDQSTLTLWFMHANASDTGGAKVVAAAEDMLAATLTPTAVFADFNLAVEEAEKFLGKDVEIVRPISQHGPLPFTNWNYKGARVPTDDDCRQWGVDPKGKPYQTIKPNDIKDYVMIDKRVTVTAQPNTKDGVMLGNILAQYDHWPVIYTVEW